MANGNYHRALLVALMILLAPSMGAAASPAAAPSVLSPPLATLYPSELSNNEIFYLGGTVTQAEGTVVVYIQNEDGATLSREVQADAQGAWFYSHQTFLRRGAYKVWTQLRVGESLSPPSSHIVVEVAPTAFQFGGRRLSYEAFYLIISALLLGIILALVVLVFYYWQHGRQKYRRLQKEISEAEEAVRRGFELLHRDITAELEIVKQAKLSRDLSATEHEREEKLLKDLGLVESYVTREVGDIGRALTPHRT